MRSDPSQKHTPARRAPLGLRLLGGVALWSLLSTASAHADGPATVVERALPAGSRMVVDDRAQDALVPFPLTMGAGDDTVREHVSGDAVRVVWHAQSEALTTAQVMSPLRAALETAGYAIALECDAALCGGFAFRFRTDTLAPPEMFVDLGNYRYLAAQRRVAAGDQWVALMVSRSATTVFVQLTAISPAGEVVVPQRRDVSASPPEAVSAPALVQTLLREGRVVLAGISFAPGADRLAQAEATSLEALAAYLDAAPEARVVLVGHTDADGPLSANLTLSLRRAQAVQRQLIEFYRVDAEQLSAEGVGYLAPRASNTTPEGRESNRRVEAVLLRQP